MFGLFEQNEMFMNFIDNQLKTKVTCSQVSTDGYEASNLLEKDNSRGFQAEYFIKPLVDISFEFLYPINVSSICLQAGLHVIESLHIFTSIHSLDPTSIGQPVMECVGRAANVTTNVLLFVNQSARCQRNEADGIAESSQTRFFLKGRQSTGIRTLTIRIIRMKNSGIPGLKSVAVWGQPSYGCAQHFLHLVNASKTTSRSTASYSAPSEINISSSPTLSSTENLDGTVPNDFLDSLTCELMLLPMLLPSGHSIDRSTLDKLMQHGKGDRDPFTGILFRKDYEPLPHSSLKTRIDAFLISNATKNQCRTLGRSTNQSVFKSSRLLSEQSIDLLECYSENKPRKLMKLNDESLIDNNSPRLTELNSTNIVCASTLPVLPNAEETHETKLTKSLQDSLRATLSSYTSFKQTKMNSNIITTKCIFCHNNHELYKLACAHFSCRKCLLKVSKNELSQCPTCGENCKWTEAIRVHNVT